MAYAVLPEPGTATGPCVPSCQHTDCALTREMSAAVCPVCGEPIGYERRFNSHGDGYAHWACLLEQAEKEQESARV